MLLYTLIFMAKILENCLATLRLILVANGKKIIGAILQGIVTLIWLYSASSVIINVKDDIYKILFFILGSFVGSYLGSLLEEKLAFGNNLLLITINKDKGLYFKNLLETNYTINILNESKEKIILLITVPRKKRHKVVNLIKLVDKNSNILTLKVLLAN